MSTLRERLASKAPRRVVQPVQIAPAGAEEAALAAEWLAKVQADPETAGDPPEALTALQEARQVEVPFRAIDSKEWEKVVAVHPAKEGDDAGMDWRAALPVVAALCCEDESMQDDDAWREILDGWSHGELVGLWGALLSINTNAPAAHLPKG